MATVTATALAADHDHGYDQRRTAMAMATVAQPLPRLPATVMAMVDHGGHGVSEMFLSRFELERKVGVCARCGFAVVPR